MTFPAYLPVGPWSLHPHAVFEPLAYFVGARLYFYRRRRDATAPRLPLEATLWLFIGCIFGAWAGSKVLAWVESPSHYFPLAADPRLLLGGKTIAGGILGGWLGIEIAKRALHITHSTGDAFVWPLAVGTALGRIGCFLSGLEDHTYGIATDLPWAVDFGDGLSRHPTQLYESTVVLLLAAGLTALSHRARHPWTSGMSFRLYVGGYLFWRLGVEFLKPRETWFLNLSAIQLASIVGMIIVLVSLRRLARAPT
ncbi:prolipoprotein diacylglyceryl transferase [Actomonas aquatica]|uniref:Prolipoprotein diacylglyceryl transferase family protein n=1 Tax=Actomonas aquatica TaxID=2866162 RepID=A0ABZ1CDF5_9BACT|nr:prolipoprotein diacylglyceryl transferase family protein [Opitutus sp. WL0086]WRQ89714.1 prolipoprotein diacylglyceryl transferase family protein [Opitutus sp. WL0086]